MLLFSLSRVSSPSGVSRRPNDILGFRDAWKRFTARARCPKIFSRGLLGASLAPAKSCSQVGILSNCAIAVTRKCACVLRVGSDSL